MRVLFIGGTGLISEASSKLAMARGHELYIFNRGGRPEFVPEGAKLIVGDIRNVKAAAEILKAYEFDVVVDWISFTPEHAQASVELFSKKTKQFMFISSASAYQKPSKHYLITEQTPLENPFWAYSRDKIACESLLMEQFQQNGFPVDYSSFLYLWRYHDSSCA